MLDDKHIFYSGLGTRVPVRDAPQADIQAILDATSNTEIGSCLIDEPATAENGFWWRLRCEIELLRRARGWPL